MKRLVYSPKINVYIKSDTGIVNLSPYVTECMVNRKVNQVSTATVTFRNPQYIDDDGNNLFLFTQRWFTDTYGDKSIQPMFHPMDPIIITFTRLKGRPIQVFTGYIDTTPYVQLFPGIATLEASCTLKRIQYTYFDPGLPFVRQFLAAQGWMMDDKGGLSNPGAESAQISGDLRSFSGFTTLLAPQQRFAAEFQRLSGLDPHVIAAWVQSEQSGSAAQNYASKNDNDWLNIGRTDSGNYGEDAGIWDDPVTAANASYKWMKGDDNAVEGYPGAIPAITNILSYSNKSAEEQIKAIQGSGWASSGYPLLAEVYNGLSGVKVAGGTTVSPSQPKNERTAPPKDYNMLGDSSIGALLFSVLEEIGGWDESTIFVEELPPQIGALVYKMFTQIEKQNKSGEDEFQSFLSKFIGSSSKGGGSSTSEDGDYTGNGDWVVIGATEFNDPPPGAGNLSASGYHFAELGTARSTDGSGTGIGWAAKALGMSGELPMGFKIEIAYNGKTIIADKQDRGYGQGGDGVTSDEHFAIDLYSPSGATSALGFSGKGDVKIRPAKKTKSNKDNNAPDDNATQGP